MLLKNYFKFAENKNYRALREFQKFNPAQLSQN